MRCATVENRTRLRSNLLHLLPDTEMPAEDAHIGQGKLTELEATWPAISAPESCRMYRQLVEGERALVMVCHAPGREFWDELLPL